MIQVDTYKSRAPIKGEVGYVVNRKIWRSLVMEDRVQKLEEKFEMLSRSQKKLFSQVVGQVERLSQQISGKQTIEIGETSTNNGCKFRVTNSKGSGLHKQFRPRPVKLDFPRYDGKDDLTMWLCRAEKELIQLRQTGMVVEYQARFEKLLAKVGSFAPHKKVRCFVTGLKARIRTDEQANLPSTLTMAISLARLFETQASWEDEEDDVVMEVEGDNEEVEPGISLHAIAGMQAPKTMKILGGFKGQLIIALIDSGSTHNFISSRVAQIINI
ncbi:hypothetical protein Ddye_008651 [Dipteronia dyeriana]|uniref:Retrotransposon gag domain-containing protein n=1 Tax=Dipteronia dyeriana TaxID=168575 RepID=A0AAE0CLK7_9ROSI|nr:hypothetical protein Ddye_008651 [Dipteronia dyeriana]